MAADTYSALLGVLFQGTGNNNNTWGALANTGSFQTIEDAIANALTSAVTGGTLDLSGTPPPAAASQVRFAALVFTGAITSNQIVIVPNLRKFWWVNNKTTVPSSPSTLTIKTTAGTGVVIPSNFGWCLVQCDGANGVTASFFGGRPLMTTTQRDAIVSPTEGLMIYNTTTHAPNYFNGTIWTTG